MQERRPTLQSYDPSRDGELEIKISLYITLQHPRTIKKNDFYSLAIFRNTQGKIKKLNHPFQDKLLQLLESPEANRSIRQAILDEIFPEVIEWFRFKNKMDNTYGKDKRIAVLKQALDNGLRLSPQETPLLFLSDGQHSPVIKFFFDHESYTTEHVMCFYKKFFYVPELCVIAIEHPKFPDTRKKYIELKGKRLRYFTGRITNFEDKKSFYQLSLSLLTHRPQIFSYEEIEKMREGFTAIHAHTDIPDDAKSIIRKSLFLAYSHPEASFLYSNGRPNTSLELAVNHGDLELFDLIYSHEDTNDTEKERCVELAISLQDKNVDFLPNFSFRKSRLHNINNLHFFYFGMMDKNEIPHELLMFIVQLTITTGQIYCMNAIIQTHKLPDNYTNKNNHSLSLFHHNPISHAWLIGRVKTGIINYLGGTPPPNEKGGTRSKRILQLICNDKLSTECKLMITDALLSEDTYYESRVKQHLVKVIEKYTHYIKKIAVEYADKYDLDLKKLGDNLLYQIHKGYLTDIIAPTITEEGFIEQIGLNAQVKKLNIK